MITMADDAKKCEERFPICHETVVGLGMYLLDISPADVPELVVALEKSGRIADGYTLEACLLRLSELGDPSWANELEFDSEADRCVVRCIRRGPLRRLVARLVRRLARKVAIRRMVQRLPREWHLQ
jgi:hypothetical protein